MAKTAVIIPARFASTRLPGKPLLSVAGKPLVQHVWERCCRAEGIDQVIVATDDMRIAKVAFDFGAEVSVTSRRHTTGTDRVAEVARRMNGFDLILNVQGDEPLVPPDLVTKLATAVREDREVMMATVAAPFAKNDDPTNPNLVKVVMDARDRALLFSRSPIPYLRDRPPGLKLWRHIGMYAYRRPFLLEYVGLPRPPLEKAESLEQLRALFYGKRSGVVKTRAAHPGVDTRDDLARVEKLFVKVTRPC
ncbi:MAG: 3-deoxy-manno-octulosonate cytidylyltransferase [Verrucomicrobiia bacterium]